ncbi:MAG TPA: hypothetical protein VKY19_09155 [Ktedonosporobacter sp.]|nr:hypothetical protein [Ktedonosporobacter sp.]
MPASPQFRGDAIDRVQFIAILPPHFVGTRFHRVQFIAVLPLAKSCRPPPGQAPGAHQVHPPPLALPPRSMIIGLLAGQTGCTGDKSDAVNRVPTRFSAQGGCGGLALALSRS